MGSAAAIPCDPGQYCSNAGMSTTNGSCTAGYYCSGSSITDSPVGQAYGDICPAGEYCPTGSSSGTTCPPGTYLATTGAQSDTECLQCTQGSYCAGYGNTATTALCDAGYYCPAGMNVSNPTAYTCPQGHYCVSGTHVEVRCLSGTYQDETGQSSCKTCPAGYYCDNAIAPVILFNNTICPEGYYCPNATEYASQYPCPRGTYNNLLGLTDTSQCTPCPGGYYCDQQAQTNFTLLCNPGFYCRLGAETGTPMEDTDAYECPVGHYCPEQTSDPQKCPAGTYSNTVRLTNVSECTDCPAGSYCGQTNMTTTSGLCDAGYYCPNGSSSATELDCPMGHYCGNGTGTPSPCTKGTFSNQTNLQLVSECDACPGGYFCLVEGLTDPTGLCGEGYYCPVGTIYQQPNTTYCPVGHYCPNGSSQALPCRNNTEVNHTHAVECNECPAGYYCDAALGQKTICPAGYFCPAGTGADWQSCPAGTYSSQTGLYMTSQCTQCDTGKYCAGEHLTAVSGDCDAGYFCTSGVNTQTPNGANNTGTGGPCPVGHYCIVSTGLPEPCQNGTYANVERESACTTCPAGYYCPDQTSDYTAFPCDMGHYCPDGTQFQFQNPCPTGSFNNQTMGTSLANCYSCTSGQYCQSTGLSLPTGLCTAGYYCDGGSDTPTPTGAGGGYCTAGYFCPEGSTEMQPCTAGEYCAGDYLNATSGQCQDGYYCSSAATMPNPTDGTTGNICPTGHYCPAGSTSASPCVSGTYLNSTGNYDSSHCVNCTAGKYCAGSGNSVPDGDCNQGYFCLGGQDSATPVGNECTQGHYCPTGSIAVVRCLSGTYQDETGQWQCKTCPAGFFCDNTIAPVVLFNNSACPEGYYCPLGTMNSNANPCPAGTFSNATQLNDSSQCQACSGGMYCSLTGLTAPEGQCDAGYYCTTGSDSRTPSLGSNADTCTTGHYCPQGSTTPTQCPPGTYNPTTGLGALSECLNCTGGKYCPDYAMTSVTFSNRCQAGYYCPSAADVAAFILCPAGAYCPQDSQDPQLCPAGTFSNNTGLTISSDCTECTAGFYCPNDGMTAATDLCWGGFYCPEGQSAPNPTAYECLRGMVCPNGSAFYQSCSNGFYTSTTGLADCEICPEGFYCLPVIPQNETLKTQDCPAGYYCPQGTGINWQSCPAGTYSSQTGLVNASQCTQCDAGKYCNSTHLTAPTGDCDPGYYCETGVDVPTPTNVSNTGSGGICYAGYYCPGGTATPLPCAAGYFANVTGQSVCQDCPAGYYCTQPTVDFMPNICPAGHYCPINTQFSTQNQCPAGTYNPDTGSTVSSECLSCPGGQYCEGQANSAPTGFCYAGWYCSGGSSEPNTTTHGGKCQPGYYCPANSSDPTQCDPGMYCETAGLAVPTGNCTAGYYCIIQASTAAPTDGIEGNICPPGHYCEAGVAAATRCNPGTYSPSTGNTNQGDCLNCTAGDYCGSYNLTVTDGGCTAGYYCPSGEVTPNRLPCPVGYYCPAGTDTPILCINGEYQDNTGESTCKPCPGGYYCDNTNGVVTINDSVLCPPGYYCPPGTPRGDTYPCDIGTFNNVTGLNDSSDCTACIGGHYCETVGLAEPTAECNAGYFCVRLAETAAPTQGSNASICPQGSYCIQGTINPVLCPAGMFGSAQGLTQVSDCTPCTAGSYCQAPGLTAVQGPCQAGYYCPQGSSADTEVICTEGSYCTAGVAAPTQCPMGTYNPDPGMSDVSQCTACTPGQFCGSTGLNETSGPCLAGFYCPGGQNSSTPSDYPCSVGHYCPLNSTAPTACANGTYMNHTMGTECYTCPAGWYCYNGNIVTLCPEGHYCPEGTDFNWQLCPSGTYNNGTGLQQETDCLSCPGGQYCDSWGLSQPTGQCDAGHFCQFGVNVSSPINCTNMDANGFCLTPGAQSGVGGLCPEGYMCPAGSVAPQPCAQGTYNNMTGQDSCQNCPAGYYCPEGTQAYEDNPCPVGHYCPAGTYVSTQYPCPNGTFYNLTLATALSDCISCLPGHYCDTPGLGQPAGMCDSGYYCTLASISATPALSSEGGPCSAGFYCPTGSAAAQSCDPGTYCQTANLGSPTGNCSAGYYCILEAALPNPTDGTTGNICPMGHYCPAGSSDKLPCDTGYFLNVTMSDDISDCSICTGGMYCPGTGNAEPAGICDPGYYCPAGQNVSAPPTLNCPVGYYCPGGTDLPQLCANGEYQPSMTQITCLICDAGYFCDNSVPFAMVNASTVCPDGYYCPAGTKYSTEFPCPIGTFNNLTGIQAESDCTPCLGGYACPVTGMTQMESQYLCEAGYFCKQGANTTTPNEGTNADVCPIGYFCPQGTVDPEPCPKGTYGNQTGLHATSDCVDCPAGDYCETTALTMYTGQCTAGYYCMLGSNQSTEYDCPAGSYCPAGSANPVPCPVGTYSNTPRLEDANNCTACDPGQYCNDTGLNSPVGNCDPGFVCPGGDSVPNPPATPCDIGLHCPGGNGVSVPCDPGTFTNMSQQSSCMTCPAGFYCVPEEVVAGNSSAGYSLCPQGYYCLQGTGRNWTACPTGTFSNVEGLDEETDCQQCSGGMYCDVTNLTSPVGNCDPGYFCTYGVDTSQPDGVGNKGVGGICPPGYKCPAGSVEAVGCPAGTYQDQTTQADCLTCPAGYFCTGNNTEYASSPCPSGHYCPNGTQYGTQYQCPSGTFNNVTTQQSISACLDCTPGEYCDTQGLSSPTGPCDAGFYCTLASALAQPTTPEGGMCLAGTYCPTGSAAPTGCDAGMYCGTNQLAAPTGNCSAGYYCTGNSTTSQPTGTGGDQCPTGSYCLAGSIAPEPCLPGTFLPSTKAQDASYCLNCTAGKYCTMSGLSAVEGDCVAGYYCPEGQITGTPSVYECPAGYHCPTGSSTYQICASGTYQDDPGQSSCKTCVEGYYCDNTNAPITNYTAYVCPQGHYCPNGTSMSTQHPCPAGTFNDQTGLTDQSQCQPCTGGYFCTLGTVTPSQPCSAGYYCRNSSMSAAPVQGVEANQCPVGHYCPEQTAEPVKCPVGTFSNAMLLMNETDCTPCTQGSYCDAQGLTAPTGLCAAGYYCETGASNDSPVECPEGRYCPEGTHTPTRCPTGTFSNATRLANSSQCTPCTAGYYCTATGLTAVEGNCTQGYYCPQGSTVGNNVICPIAFHCPETSAAPQECPDGSYTTQTGKYTCDSCPQGYFCVPDNVTAGDANSALFDCPAGKYCPTGTGYTPLLCPKGTYSTATRLYEVSQCTDCDGRYYCDVDGATAVTALCSPGYYCQSGVDRPNPDNAATNSSYPASCPLIGGHTGYGDMCPTGSYCPEGTDSPIACPAGSYQDNIGQWECKGCPEGYYCDVNSTTYTDKPCPTGHYCPSNTTSSTEFPCAIGTFNPNTAQTNASSCLDCTGGTYCDGFGLSAPAGNCSGGYYCSGGATQSKPTSSAQGGKCTHGEYCPEGSDAPTFCDPGKYCGSERLSAPSGDCTAGYYCTNASNWHQPFTASTGGKCPVGHYCPTGSGAGIPCPMGYYLDVEQSTQLSDCKICPAGYYCAMQGLDNPNGTCSPGYYCPVGQNSATPANYSCEAGYYCAGGQSAPVQCASGTYQDQPIQASCITCPAGFYCDKSIAGPVVNYTSYLCPEGSYCPDGTQFSTEYLCPLGTYNNATGVPHQDNCTACTGGMACDQTGLTNPINPCSAGYFCKTGATSQTPAQGTDADVCPTGSYCPTQTADPVPCPQGTYNPSTQLHAEAQCLNCTGGSYCNDTGLSAVVGPCFAGYYCPIGSDSASKEQCTVGNYCPVGTEYPVACPNGTYSNNVGNGAVGDCSDCTPGYYCNGAGLTNYTGPCKQGYYCPAGSSVETEVICPIGKHCPTGSDAPQDCAPGYYTGATGKWTCDECPEGFYCIAANVVAGNVSTVMTACPAGYFCPNGTGSDWQPCPSGTYSNTLGLTQESECTACTGGYYCSVSNLTAPSGQCGAGYYCTSGAPTFNPTMLSSSQCPTNTTHPILGDICPIGHYCPEGTPNPMSCPAGTYQDQTTQSGCKACPDGYFCLVNTTDFSPNICPAGHYCPENTTFDMEFPCPAQTFNNATQGRSLADCTSCLPGMYCATPGLSEPTGNCSAGFYCFNGSDTDRPTVQGGRCVAGTYCPAGATYMYNCTLGMYCSQAELAAPEGDCDEGYYCPGGATSPQEYDCPVGHYCPTQTGYPQPCRNGTFAATTNLKSDAECTPCTAGYYCNGTGLHQVSGQCDAGFYCPPGQTEPTPYTYRCEPGYYCLANSPDHTICPSGQYQNEYQQDSCKNCPAGYFCDNANGAIGNLSNYECITGFYCPGSVVRDNEFPCPAGTYNNLTMLTASSQCQPCLPGYYCQNPGLSVPEGLCLAGYYCNGSTIEPNPSDGVCPVGNYCPTGSDAPIPCASGTIATGTGNDELTDCEPCKPGNYCTAQSSQSGFSLKCSAGYICLNGSDVAAPTDGVKGYACPVGYYCEEGAVQETPCPRGHYAPATASAVCTECAAGFSCPNLAMNTTLPCPTGRYCYNGTVDDGEPCPAGTYNPDLSADSPGSCLACTAGNYCEIPGLSAPTGNCTAGYLCLSNSTSTTPNDGVNGPCPIAQYCVEGTTAGVDCPLGTLRNETGGTAVTDCYPCTGGQYCDQLASIQAAGVCAERYYCPAADNIDSSMPTGYLCPAGFYCPNGTADPIGCDPGTYQINMGEISCDVCPMGSYCPQNTSTPIACPAYSYCPDGSAAPTLCLNGTYTLDATTGLQNWSDCLSCVAGKYCTGGQIAGDCQAGFICYSGIGVPDPDDSYLPNGGICPYGFYCPAGITQPQVCPNLKFIANTGATSQADCTDCPNGRICPANSTVSEPCWKGYYCPIMLNPTKCPIGTYNELEEQYDISACLPCPAGFYCDFEGMANYTVNPCPLGHYCVNASITPEPCPAGRYRDVVSATEVNDCTLCPGGSYCPDTNMTFAGYPCSDGQYCPEGATIQRQCKAGFYCNNSETQLSCPPAYYCPENSTQPTYCPPGHYCLGNYFDTCNCTDAGAIEPEMCSPGTAEKVGSDRITFETTCEACRAGTYSATDGSACSPCQAGVVCLAAATTDNPVSNTSTWANLWGVNATQSYPCPTGYYCPEGSAEPTPCPTGTYNQQEWATSLSDCLECAVDSFNDRTGQTKCSICGSQASQPNRGQATCQCLGNGRDFQESDRECVCKAGFYDSGVGQDCSRYVYELCKKNKYRYQDGNCYSKGQLEQLCRDNVCTNNSFVEADEHKAFCICQADDLETICDIECRSTQDTIKWICAAEPTEPYIEIKDTNGTVVKQYVASSISGIINSANSFSASTCSSRDDSSLNVHLLVMDDTTGDFLGAYNVDSSAMINILDFHVKDNITGFAANDSTGTSRRRLLATSTFSGSTFTGISNPITCLENGEYMMFAVDQNNYPIYDVNNLLNTNTNFDYGGFRALVTAQTQTSTTTTLFAYQFTEAGSYVFYSSANVYKKIYIRVMQTNTQCATTGPFFPVTANNIVANGIALQEDILQEPDWPVILTLLSCGVLVIILMIVALLLFRKYGWLKSTYLFPYYRLVTSKYDFDNYASKGSTVYPVRKYHRNMAAIQAGAGYPLPPPPGGDVAEHQEDDFWDYNRQVDLEGFSSKRVYDTLAKQSRDATQTLASQKDEVKQMYGKVASQTDSLKALWAAKMNLKGMAVFATDEDLANYDRKLDFLEKELERRKEVGCRFEAILNRQQNLANDDEKYREEHQVSYQASLREAVRTLQDYTDRLQRGQVVDADGQFDHAAHQATEARVGTLIQKMSADLNTESERLGCWGVLGQGTGAQLLSGSTPVTRADIFGGKVESLAQTDKATGLLRARSGAQMLLADGSIRPVPADNFIHPQTGNVLPIQGNVAFDPVTSRLVFVVDSATGEAPRSSDPFIPFVPYPIINGQPIKTGLRSLPHASDLKYGGPMSDPETSLHVPILAVTLHPVTGEVLPVGGTHIDVVTGLPVPIEVGSLMVDPNSGLPVPILAVTLDPESGSVVPVGGVHQNNAPIIPGESFTEPLSGKKVRVHGGHLMHAQVAPSAGGYQGLLDSNVLACEARVSDAVRMYLEAISNNVDSGGNSRHEEAALESAIKELDQAREKMKQSLLRTHQDIKRRQERARILATTGGSPGMYEFSKTGQLLPILVGMTMLDPAGSGQDVPILGAERHKQTGKVIPLGGTLEDPEGAGLVPISIGKRAIDPVTGEMSPVIGARLSPDSSTIVPITLSSSAHRKRTPPPGAMAMLEEEIVTRRGYWRRQRQKEQDVTVIEHKLALALLQDTDSVTVKSVSAALEQIDTGSNTLSEAGKREFQRRGAAEQEYSSILPPEVVAVLTDCDAREAEMEEGHVAAHVKFADSIRKFFNKLQQEEKKFKDKMDNISGEEGENLQVVRYRQAKNRLLADLQGQIITRMEKLDEAHSALEYARQRSELCCQESKIVLTHAALLAGDYDAQMSGVYGDADSTDSGDSELVPLLKQLIAMLESGGPFYLSSELLNLINSAAGGGNVQNVNNMNNTYNMGDGAGRDGDKVKLQTAAMVQASSDKDKDKRDKNKGKHSKKDKKGGQSDSPSQNDEDAWNNLTRKLFEQQAYAAAKLENDLKSEEITSIQDTIDEFEKKKKRMMEEAREDLKLKLEKIDNEKERDRIMNDYAVNLQKVNDAFDRQKQQQLETLRKKLLEDRRNRKKQLYRKHCEEAQANGVGIEAVPDVNLASYDDLMKDLLRLQENQERALAEMEAEGEHARENVQVPEVDREFEKKIRAMDVDDAVKDAMLRKAAERNHALQEQIDGLKRMLRQRKDRTKPTKLSEEEKQGLSEDEQRSLIKTRELQAEADREREDRALLEARQLMEKEQQRLDYEAAMRDKLRNVTEEERDRILAQYQSEMEKLSSRQEDARQSQKDKIVGKLAARKRLREEMEKEQVTAKELDRITKRHVSQGDSDAAQVINGINNKVNNDKLSPEQERLIKDQTQATESVEERQRGEQREVNRNLDNEMAAEELTLETQIQQQKRLAVGEHKNKFDRDMLLNRQNLSEDEYKRLLAEHEREMAALVANMDLEKDRQKRSIKDKILERKKKRDSQLEEKHRLEMEEEMTRQQQERDKLNESIARKVEDEELKKNTKDLSGEKAENLVYTVLRQRHLKEAIHLEDQLAREMAAARRRARAEAEQNRQREREILLQAFEQEMVDLVANSKGMSEEELQARKHDLKREQKRQRKDFDKLTKQLADQAEKDVIPEVEVQQTYKRLELKEKQLTELSDAMTVYTPSDTLKKKYAEEAKMAALKAREFKDDVLRKMEAEFEKRKKAEREKEEERKRKLEEHYRKLQQELEEEHRREEQKLKEREEEKQRLKQRQLEERQRNQAEEIQKSNSSEEEKQRLLREHTMNMEKLQENLLEEQGRSKAALAAKLEARKKKRGDAAMAKLGKDKQLEEDAQHRKDIAHRQQESALMGDNNSANRTETSDVLIGQLPTNAGKPGTRAGSGSRSRSSAGSERGGVAGIPSSGNSEQDWVNLLMASPLFNQINDLETMLEKSDMTGEATRPQIKGGDYSHPYIDVKDAQWMCAGDLSPVDSAQISPSQYVVYRFGVFVIRLLHQQIGTPEVTLLLASNLPPNNYERNAFRNSVFYEYAKNILFVRKERMDSIGEFVVLILHAVSHIHVGEMTDDTNTHFLRLFYKCLKVVCQDMFFSRSKTSPVSQSVSQAVIGPQSTNGRAALEQALAPLAKKTDDKINVIGELVDMKVDGPSRKDFSKERMGQRVYGSENLASNARLRQYLASRGGYMASSDFIATRMAELKGSAPPASPRASLPKRVAPPMHTPRDVVGKQLSDLHTKSDSINEELAEVLKIEAALREGLRDMESDPRQRDSVQTVSEQLEKQMLRKTDLLKQIGSIEADIAKKEKEAKR